MYDYNGGVQPSGLFWIIQVSRDDLQIDQDGRRATLKVRERAVIDSFQFGGANSVPGTVSFTVRWQAIGPAQSRRKASAVPTDHEAAFLARFARARSTGFFKGSLLGFSFRSNSGTTDRGYAEMGRERNGVSLTADVSSRSKSS